MASASYPPTVFILGASSDIGSALAQRYLRDGYKVVGTYRSPAAAPELMSQGDIRLFYCDAREPKSIRAAAAEYAALNQPWDIFISAIGTEEPIGNFFACDFDAWEQSVIVNSTAQLRALHAIYPWRKPHQVVHAVFFAGGGTNSTFSNYSAYCVSKILLIKMCELLDDENSDLNVFILGPGWVRTKIHQQTLANPDRAGANYRRTLEFVNSQKPGTSNDEIYDCINWCAAQGRGVAGGRDFSVVHDPWRNNEAGLARRLQNDPDKYKLRRFGNRD